MMSLRSKLLQIKNQSKNSNINFALSNPNCSHTNLVSTTLSNFCTNLLANICTKIHIYFNTNVFTIFKVTPKFGSHNIKTNTTRNLLFN